MREKVLVVFGATGDLFEKKLLPALFQLYENGNLSKELKVIGFARREYSSADFRDFITQSLKEGVLSKNVVSEDFLNKFDYISSKFEDQGGYQSLSKLVADFTNAEVYFYMSTPPNSYTTILENLNKNLETKNTAIIIEKPVGKSLEEARNIHDTMLKYFQEDKIFRIDHYLHKTILKNIFALRFHNSLFLNNWNNTIIEKIEIVTNEKDDVEDRAEFYNSTGALLDVGQNHLLEVLALILMRQPKEFTKEAILDERAQAINTLAIDKFNPGNAFRAQYSDFLTSSGINNSNTESYFRLKLHSINAEWTDVPIYLEAGKGLAEDSKYIRITLKESNLLSSKITKPNDIRNTIYFDIGLTPNIKFSYDLYGDNERSGLCETGTHQRYKYIDEYMNALQDIFNGDQTWFVSQKEVEASWKFIDPIRNAWNSNEIPLLKYKKNTAEAIQKARELEDQNSEIKTLPKSGKQIGMVGIGKMGWGLAAQLAQKEWDIKILNRTGEISDKFVSEFGGEKTESIKEMVEKLESPRRIWLMLPAGEPTEEIIFGEEGLIKYLEKGDIIIDGANSQFEDSIRRHAKLKEAGIQFLDAGVSGGPEGARNGACIMIGGERDTYSLCKNIFKDIAAPAAYSFFEGAGTGHFIKMVHNAIEYGMMQSIAEGLNLLHEYPNTKDQITEILQIYNNNSVIESKLVKLAMEGFSKYGLELKNVSGAVAQSGEGKWTVDYANRMSIPLEIISKSVEFRVSSQSNPSYTGKVLMLMRHMFGGHSLE